MGKTVTVQAHPETGEIFNPTGNEDWGTIRVDTPKMLVNTNGILDLRSRSAFLKMRKEVFDQMGLEEGSVLKGTVIYKTSNFPQYEGHKPKINPNTKEVVLGKDGLPEYFTSHHTFDENAKDEYLVKEGVKVSQQEEEESQSL
jgi:hypothetical protein